MFHEYLGSKFFIYEIMRPKYSEVPINNFFKIYFSTIPTGTDASSSPSRRQSRHGHEFLCDPHPSSYFDTPRLRSRGTCNWRSRIHELCRCRSSQCQKHGFPGHKIRLRRGSPLPGLCALHRLQFEPREIFRPSPDQQSVGTTLDLLVWPHCRGFGRIFHLQNDVRAQGNQGLQSPADPGGEWRLIKATL